MTTVCRDQLGEDYLAQLPEEPFFVDFLREAPEPTGEEADDDVLDAPHIYEQVGQGGSTYSNKINSVLGLVEFDFAAQDRIRGNNHSRFCGMIPKFSSKFRETKIFWKKVWRCKSIENGFF